MPSPTLSKRSRKTWMNCADLLLAAHDAGGGQLLFSWSREHPENSYRYCLQGPALELFTRALGPLPNIPLDDLAHRLEEKSPDLILTATSWSSRLEMDVRALGAAKGIRTAAYLDHWVNYRERFGYPGRWLENLPDEIWCPDPESLKRCALDGFPAGLLVMAGNPYLDGLAVRVAALGIEEEPGTVLYICEPVGEHMRMAHGDPLHKGYDEFGAMRLFFAAIKRWDPVPLNVRVRLHPSEREGKYDAFLKDYLGSVVIQASVGTDLLEDIARASSVAGCESMAMVVALKAGKKVYTSIPPHGERCSLPFDGIKPV